MLYISDTWLISRLFYTFLATLTELSMTTKELCAVHLYVSNMADFAKVNAVYKTYFGTNPPVR